MSAAGSTYTTLSSVAVAHISVVNARSLRPGQIFDAGAVSIMLGKV